MKALLDRATSRASDRRMIDAGVPGMVLMENAGRGAAEEEREQRQQAADDGAGGPAVGAVDAQVKPAQGENSSCRTM